MSVRRSGPAAFGARCRRWPAMSPRPVSDLDRACRFCRRGRWRDGRRAPSRRRHRRRRRSTELLDRRAAGPARERRDARPARAARAARRARPSAASTPIAWSDAGVSAGARGDRRSPARALDARRGAPRSTARRGASSDRARRRRTRWPSPSAWRPISPRAASSSSAAWRAASIRRRIAARSRAADRTVAVLGSGADVDLSARARGARARDSNATALVMSELVPGHAAAAALLSAAQPHHQRPVARGRRRRGGREERVAHHGAAARSSRDATCWPCRATSSAAVTAAPTRFCGTVQRLWSRRTISWKSWGCGREPHGRRRRTRRPAAQRSGSGVPDRRANRPIWTRLPSDPG